MFCPFKLDPLEILGIHWVFSTQAYGTHTIPLHSNKSLYLPLRKKLAISVSSSPLQTYMSNTFEIQCNSCNPYHKMTIRSLGAKTEKLKNPTGHAVQKLYHNNFSFDRHNSKYDHTVTVEIKVRATHDK